MATIAERLATKTAFINELRHDGCSASGVSRSILMETRRRTGLYKVPPGWIVLDKSRQLGDAMYTVPEIDDTDTYLSVPIAPVIQEETPIAPAPVQGSVVGASSTVATTATSMIMGMTGGERDSLIPQKNQEYVPWGHFKDIEKIVRTKRFYPIFVTGLSGNGKTLMVEQVCAKLKRECYRVNITRQTDEDDLIGGFRLVGGDTKFCYGPVVNAMKTGGVLLLDECDLASHNIMCLQPVLEGKGVFIKKIGEWVTPAPGFTVFATANTKGKGSDDGRFIGTGVMNEAFLDRFPITMEQPYATPNTETKILGKAGCEKEFADHLVKWASVIRKSFYEGGVDEVISTRRLVDIVRAFGIFNSKEKAIALCLARFDDDTKQAFMDLYGKVDAEMHDLESGDESPTVSDSNNKCPF